jgi:hypothetical protein
VTDVDRFTAAELDALTGADLWGVADRITGGYALGGEVDGGEIGDHRSMEEAEVRTMEIDCKRCGRKTEHEISATEEEGVSVANCLRCREIDAEAMALVEQRQRAAEVARRADQFQQRAPGETRGQQVLRETMERKAKEADLPWWKRALILGGGIVALCAVGAVMAVVELRRRNEEHGGDNSDDRSAACHNKSAAAIENASNLARRVCECSTVACAQAVIRDANVTTDMIERIPCPVGFMPHQLDAIESHLARGQVCIDRLGGR